MQLPVEGRRQRQRRREVNYVAGAEEKNIENDVNLVEAQASAGPKRTPSPGRGRFGRKSIKS